MVEYTRESGQGSRQSYRHVKKLHPINPEDTNEAQTDRVELEED